MDGDWKNYAVIPRSDDGEEVEKASELLLVHGLEGAPFLLLLPSGLTSAAVNKAIEASFPATESSLWSDFRLTPTGPAQIVGA